MTDPRSSLRRVEPTPADLDRVASALDDCFGDDPVTNFMINSAPPARRDSVRKNHWFQSLVTAAAKNGAEIYQIDDWSGVSIWIPPGKSVDNPMTLIPSGVLTLSWKLGLKGLYRMFFCFERAVHRALAEHLQGRNHWYCFFVAVKPASQGRGLSRFLLEPHAPQLGHVAATHDTPELRRRARCGAAAAIPVWLEATTPKSMEIYTHLGWKNHEEIRLGKGYTNEMGNEERGGAGVPVWCMSC